MQNVSGRQHGTIMGAINTDLCEDCPVGTFGNDRGTSQSVNPAHIRINQVVTLSVRQTRTRCLSMKEARVCKQ